LDVKRRSGKRDPVRSLKSRETEFNAALLKPGFGDGDTDRG
jgi:hypothetical protein